MLFPLKVFIFFYFYLKEAEFKYLNRNKNKFQFYDLIKQILLFNYENNFNFHNIATLNSI